MNNELEEWFREHWRRDNHPKYQRYFDEWIKNILPSQIEGFKKQMFNEKNGVLSSLTAKKK